MASDYGRIEKALTYLTEHADEQPDLDQVAAKMGLSPFHFQRLFTRWAGVSPKKFLQYLTLERAKACLRGSASVLDAAYEAGLSGPGRLHDLFIAHEAVSPGEYKRRGEGLPIAYGVADSPFGDCVILTTPRGICGLGFVVDGDHEGCIADLLGRFPRAQFRKDESGVARIAESIFERPDRRRTLRLMLHGSPFQIKVWEALMRIPPGALVSYEDVARTVCTTRASRAVGAAVGANPISFLVPCHRVIHKSGIVTRYHWGPTRKLAMIGFEAAAAEQPREAAIA